MLDRLDARQPLKPGMRVLDASCGSGAFLVQCYRKLAERRRQDLGRRLRPAELGTLLRNHIFGVDLDEDACQIAELLVLTLLDYVDPPDLTETNWQLPALRDRNIFCANAFNDDEKWFKTAQKHSFDWIVRKQRFDDRQAAIESLKQEGMLPRRVRQRQCKYLNNVIEQDHRNSKKRVWLAKGYKSFPSARRTLEGIETMHMIRKGRVKRGAKKDVVAEAKFVAKLFGLAA